MCPVPVTCPRTARQHGPRHNRRNFNRPGGDAFRVLHLINVSSYLSPYLLSYYHHAIIISSYIYIHICISSLLYLYHPYLFSIPSLQLNSNTPPHDRLPSRREGDLPKPSFRCAHPGVIENAGHYMSLLYASVDVILCVVIL